MSISLRHRAKRLKGTELDEYVKVCLEFCNYLDSTSMTTMRTKGIELLSNSVVESNHEYVHRWTEVYRKSVVSKFYQLEEWFNKNPQPITMMTLSGYQGGGYTRRTKPWLKDAGKLSREIHGHELTMEETFQNINQASEKLFKILRKEIPDLTYLWVVEPHKSGYPHYHVILFHEISEELQDKIKSLWSEKYQAGSFDKGVDFSVRPVQDSIKSLKNYLLKYVVKGFRKSGSKFENDSITWTPEELCFNAVVWKNHYRLFGCSRNLSRVMKYKGDDTRSKSIIWFSLDMGNTHGDFSRPVWSKTPEQVLEIRNEKLSAFFASDTIQAPESPSDS